MPVYQQPGLTLQRGGPAPADAVREMQRDLRALGYLRSGIDGSFGDGTEAAIRSLQFDLLHNTGSAASDGTAPVSISAFNGVAGPPVAAVTGILDQALASCMVAMLADPRITPLPCSDTPAADNAKAMAAVEATTSTMAPMPYISAIVLQESGGRQFAVPQGANADNFIIVGLDRNNAADKDQITSRGYGMGQYTLFHHPPRAEEVTDFMLDPVLNVQRAVNELREKFDHFVVGPPSSRADDRFAEHPLINLRLCRYSTSDPRYMRDCGNCARAVRKVAITNGTPFYPGSSGTYAPTQYYATANYSSVPDRASFLCDWPYALRRYNGSGINSYHYQTRVLLNLAALPQS